MYHGSPRKPLSEKSMDRRCKEYEEGLATLAEGREDTVALAHLATCPACSARLSDLRRLVNAARLEQHDAPAELVARAKALVAPSRRTLIARLLGSSLTAAGARKASDDAFSLHMGAEELSVRLHYTLTKEGWDVTGRAPAGDWILVHDGVESDCGGSGRFQFFVSDLAGTAFTLRTADAEIFVPPASELLGRAT